MSGEEEEGEDEGEGEGEEKKSHYLLKRERRGSDHGSSKLGNRKKKEKKTQVSIFIHTQKTQVPLENCNFPFLQSCITELVNGSNSIISWVKFIQRCATDLLLQMIISPEMFSFDTGCNESYDVVKSRQRGFRRVLSFLRQSMTYKNNISPPLQFREFLYLMSFIILEIK